MNTQATRHFRIRRVRASKGAQKQIHHTYGMGKYREQQFDHAHDRAIRITGGKGKRVDSGPKEKIIGGGSLLP